MNTSLDNATKFFARNCECRPISSDEARDFMDQHHRQGSTKDKTVSCGIYSPGGDLLGVISFCSPRTAAKRREYSRELVRLCFKSGVRVVGGASKLFKFYTKTYSPADIFTYQDATGEVTDVYEKSGMKFVSQGKRKSYLVAPGKTLDTGSRREVLGLAYAVRYGPDRILGTKVGEVFDPQTGKRKSNRDIFLENLGWHIEDTNGDRVYEWINPSMTHYVYKITASDSKKYYYGVSHVKKADATVDDCLADDYWGSGGSLSSNKFNNWKKKHKDTLQKEILRRFKRKSEAYNFEKSIIGDLYATDKLCLNSIMGGKDGGVNGWKESSPLNESICEIHGKTFFIGIK